MSLRTITNYHLDVQVWDLDPSWARGPFVVVQEGCAPGDETAREKMFLLRHDGVWVDSAYYLASSGRDKVEEIVFPSTAEVMSLLHQLTGPAQVSPMTASKRELAAWHAANPHIEANLAGLRQWATEYRKRQAETR